MLSAPISEEGELDAETDAILSWLAGFERGIIAATGPQRITSQVVLFRTKAGAGACIELQPTRGCSAFVGASVDTDAFIGEATRVWIWDDMQPNGRNRVEYLIAFARGSVYLAASGLGREGYVEPEFVEQSAHTLLEKVDRAPLMSDETLTP